MIDKGKVLCKCHYVGVADHLFDSMYHVFAYVSAPTFVLCYIILLHPAPAIPKMSFGKLNKSVFVAQPQQLMSWDATFCWALSHTCSVLMPYVVTHWCPMVQHIDVLWCHTLMSYGVTFWCHMVSHLDVVLPHFDIWCHTSIWHLLHPAKLVPFKRISLRHILLYILRRPECNNYSSPLILLKGFMLPLSVGFSR